MGSDGLELALPGESRDPVLSSLTPKLEENLGPGFRRDERNRGERAFAPLCDYIPPAMSRRFLKMNGLGNDFVVVESDDFMPTPDQVRAWGSRESGVGFDQLIAISNDGSGSPLVRF